MALVSMNAYPPPPNLVASPDNATVPGETSWSFQGDTLIAGEGAAPFASQPILLASGNLRRGSVLGQISPPVVGAGQPVNESVFATPGTANVGNGSVGSITAAPIYMTSTFAPQIGNYHLTATSPTVFAVVDPEGVSIGSATVGTAFVSSEMEFTIFAGATPFVVGDSFVLTSTDTVGAFVLCARTATDGSQVPVAILADDANASGGPVKAGAYLSGEFNADGLSFDATWTAALLTTALRGSLVFIKSMPAALSAADPS